MTFLYVVLSLPRAISRPWILFRWKKSIGADHEKLRVIFIGFLCCSCLTYITGKLVSLDLSVDSMFVDFFKFLTWHNLCLSLCVPESFRVGGYTSQGKDCFLIYPDIIYCTQFENVPIYLSSRTTRVLICRLCESSSTIFQDKHIDYRVIKLIFE